jgi:hypothetical protein
MGTECQQEFWWEYHNIALSNKAPITLFGNHFAFLSPPHWACSPGDQLGPQEMTIDNWLKKCMKNRPASSCPLCLVLKWLGSAFLSGPCLPKKSASPGCGRIQLRNALPHTWEMDAILRTKTFFTREAKPLLDLSACSESYQSLFTAGSKDIIGLVGK